MIEAISLRGLLVTNEVDRDPSWICVEVESWNGSVLRVELVALC